MAKAVKCDRCGKLFEFYSVKEWNGDRTVPGYHTIGQGSYTDHDGYYRNKIYELCLECCKEFNEWLDKPARID